MGEPVSDKERRILGPNGSFARAFPGAPLEPPTRPVSAEPTDPEVPMHPYKRATIDDGSCRFDSCGMPANDPVHGATRPVSADELAAQQSGRLSLQLLAAVTRELRDAAVAFQGPTETPAEAGQRATRLRKAVELATEAIAAVPGHDAIRVRAAPQPQPPDAGEGLREPPPNCVEYLLEDGRRFAWSESNVRYEELPRTIEDALYTILDFMPSRPQPPDAGEGLALLQVRDIAARIWRDHYLGGDVDNDLGPIDDTDRADANTVIAELDAEGVAVVPLAVLLAAQEAEPPKDARA